MSQSRVCLLLLSVLLSGTAVNTLNGAELPELGSPSAVSGESTTARFFGAATNDSGDTYQNRFSSDDALDILAEVRVEARHVGTVGNLYVVATDGKQFYQRLQDGGFDLWNGDVATLSPASPVNSLQAVERITVLEGLTFEQLGVTEGTIQVYVAYDASQNPGELYYSGEPIVITIADEQRDSFQLYVADISQPIIQENCIVCHSPGGVAEASNLVYAGREQPLFQQNNFDVLVDFILELPGGSQLILDKPQGNAHGGGVQLSPESSEFATFSEFVAAVVSSATAPGGDGQAIFDNVDMLDNVATLRKASLLFAGRLPTEEELDSVSGAGESALRTALRGMMSGDGFVNFLLEGANDRLLTRAYRNNLFLVVNRYRFPNARRYFAAPTYIGSDSRMTSEAIADEPLRLIVHVVTNERPYTEILTADYIMVNPWSAEVFGVDVIFDNPGNANEWREGRITAYYRCEVCTTIGDLSYPNYNIPTDYPHAGILNSPVFLARFPSTSTNRNRARARWTYYFFLGIDIEKLSERTTDPDALADENNPTLNNPECTVCHDIMDPVAGTFQNYGDNGFYRDQPGGEHSLPRSYRRDPEGLYQPGDIWYADMLAPGFKDLQTPDPDNSLQWLAQQIVVDDRFGAGAVNFWYQAVMGREMLAEPENLQDDDYAARMEAYVSEQEFVATVATDFIQGSHGNGEYNLKDLLVDLALSDYFRARSSSSLSEQKRLRLSDVGYGVLLTPEQLNRKLLEVAGFEWRYGRFNALTEVYGLIYGGIDPFGVTERIRNLTVMMSAVISAMANETSCAIVAQDFGKPQERRLLFPHVELTSLPTTHSDAIRKNIQYLHWRFLGENLAVGNPEIDASFNLFAETWRARIDAGKAAVISSNSELCILENVNDPVTLDPNQTLRSWAAVINYLLRDYRFIHE